MSDPSKAVFLSYASQDAEAARRIAEALRAVGVEVWFDQNELVGGDAWDAKIKKQIQTCALFVPVISANTQAREEGYFRREWNLAANRTLDMAHDKAFLLPIVIDATSDAVARVPDKFREVQWTRLPGGETSPAFAARVKTLLGGDAAPSGQDVGTRLARAQSEGRGPATPQPGKRSPLPLAAAAVVVLAAIAAALFFSKKSEPPVAPTKPVAQTTPAAPTPAPAPALPPLAPEKSVAVLPFENLSPDKDNAFFADGVHEDVITSLTKIRDLKVIGRTSVLSYRDPATRDHKKIAAELGVATVLEGSVRRIGTKVHVTAQLTDARTNQALWAETYDRDLTDVFAIQSALSQEIAAALKANLTVGERALITERPTNSQEAYDLYLRARTTFENSARPRDKILKAIELYEQAVAKDPKFAAAYTQLVYLHGRMYWGGAFDATPERMAQAKSALEATLRLAPNRPETRLARGAFIYYCENDWERALAEYRAAETGMPNDAQVSYFIGLTHRRLSHWTEAHRYLTRAVELNPRDINYADTLLETLHDLRRYTTELEVAGRCLVFLPGDRSVMRRIDAARMELSHDSAAYLAVAMTMARRNSQAAEYWSSMAKGEFAGAEKALSNMADAGVKSLPTFDLIIEDPISLHRARVAFLLGNRDAARAYAEETIAIYAGGKWTPRQTGVVMLGRAYSAALAGRSDEGLKLAHEAYDWQFAHDRYLASDMIGIVAQIYLVLDRRDDAFAALSIMMTEPHYMGPEQLRLDPLWARVKDDPRFEEILKSAKPL